MNATAGLPKKLSEALQSLRLSPFPHVSNPPGCEKRASVALVLKVRPAYADSAKLAAYGAGPESSQRTYPRNLGEFFDHDWVQNGDAEILFIKRAGRAGDRWSGHVAFPGGRRDPPDVDDRAAAIRETREEVGLDLTRPDCLYAGNLPERVVTTTWGKKGQTHGPVPFCLRRDKPRISFSVAATSRSGRNSLGTPSEPSLHFSSDPRAGRSLQPVRKIYQSSIELGLASSAGKMMFSAIHLVPSESLFAPPSTPLKQSVSDNAHFFSRLARGAFGVPSSAGSFGPLLAWGISLGILVDLLEMLPTHNAVELWRYPTFTVPDLRLLIYLFTYQLRKDNARLLNSGTWPSHTAADETTAAIAISEAEPHHIKPDHVCSREKGKALRQSPALNLMISGYYERMNVAITVFLALRFTAATALGYYALRAWISRSRGR